MKPRLMSIRSLGLLAALLPSLAMAQGKDKPAASPAASSTTEGTVTPAEVKLEGDTADANAQDNAEAAPKAQAAQATAAAAPVAPEVAKASGKPEATASVSDVGVQRVPGSGYPGAPTDESRGIIDAIASGNWKLGNTSPGKIRGIYGGSLWLTFHGLQWPYMPQKPGEPALMLGLGGSGWVDTAYQKISSTDSTYPSQKYLRQQGRLVLRVTPTYRTGRWFVQGQAELVAFNDQSNSSSTTPAQTDDLWLRAGMWDAFDVQAGRFEAWEVYHLGMGLDLNTFERTGAILDGQYKPTDFYGVNYAYYRPNGAGNIAGHFYFADWLRLEALTRLGNDSGFNMLGERGALILDFGWVKFKGAGEYLRGTPMNPASSTKLTQRGGGGSLLFILDPFAEFGANAAYGMQDQIDTTGIPSPTASNTRYSYGGFGNVRLIGDLIAGGGLNYTHFEDIHIDTAGAPYRNSQTQAFAALQYGLFRQLFLKLVLAYADAYFAPNLFDAADPTIPILPFHDKMYSARLRASMYF